jgi:hypothetical protein
LTWGCRWLDGLLVASGVVLQKTKQNKASQTPSATLLDLGLLMACWLGLVLCFKNKTKQDITNTQAMSIDKILYIYPTMSTL